MATTKPRITVTLEPRVYELLRIISQSSSQSMSAFVGDLLASSVPVFERMAVTFQQVAQVSQQQRQQIADAVDDAQRSLEPVMQQVIGQYDIFLEQAGLTPDAGQREGGDAATRDALQRARVAAAPTARPRTNRGATNPAPKALKPKSGKASKGG